MRVDRLSFGDSDQLWVLDHNRLLSVEDGEFKLHINNLDEPKDLTCGISGDGCGGGRVFIACKEAVVVYNPQTSTIAKEFRELGGVSSIEKRGCFLYLIRDGVLLRFDLSAMKLVFFEKE